MQTSDTIMIRYTSTDAARRYVLQRGDYKFWTGEDWHERLAHARVFASHQMSPTELWSQMLPN